VNLKTREVRNPGVIRIEPDHAVVGRLVSRDLFLDSERAEKPTTQYLITKKEVHR
jgi:hypothetical protein